MMAERWHFRCNCGSHGSDSYDGVQDWIAAHKTPGHEVRYWKRGNKAAMNSISWIGYESMKFWGSLQR